VGSIPIPGTENKRLTACPTSPQNPKNGPVVLVLYLLQKKTPIGNLIKADQGMNCLFYTRIQALLQNDAINRERGIRCVETMSSPQKSGQLRQVRTSEQSSADDVHLRTVGRAVNREPERWQLEHAECATLDPVPIPGRKN